MQKGNAVEDLTGNERLHSAGVGVCSRQQACGLVSNLTLLLSDEKWLFVVLVSSHVFKEADGSCSGDNKSFLLLVKSQTNARTPPRFPLVSQLRPLRERSGSVAAKRSTAFTRESLRLLSEAAELKSHTPEIKRTSVSGRGGDMRGGGVPLQPAEEGGCWQRERRSLMPVFSDSLTNSSPST